MDESIPEETSLTLVIIREKKIGQNIIKEDISLSAEVKSITDAPVKKYFEHYLSFQHLFLSQRAFISKILPEDKK